ncbi:hypothetical protein A7K73_09940 [Candidatus Methylacidiphilum fumarolicum]|nr:hypothetical protein A7K73_09940 [Candidatus Methylacidiphilum fumarolicum]TFE73648.1 hypothetical protein A7K72_06045 [Candidatus Methylacidiphilum fumarolicum]TFE77628.1 hypothetical protein A7D33_03825 [Candidatus Methylacidiphilum fumarolicum]
MVPSGEPIAQLEEARDARGSLPLLRSQEASSCLFLWLGALRGKSLANAGRRTSLWRKATLAQAGYQQECGR